MRHLSWPTCQQDRQWYKPCHLRLFPKAKEHQDWDIPVSCLQIYPNLQCPPYVTSKARNGNPFSEVAAKQHHQHCKDGLQGVLPSVWLISWSAQLGWPMICFIFSSFSFRKRYQRKFVDHSLLHPIFFPWRFSSSLSFNRETFWPLIRSIRLILFWVLLFTDLFWFNVFSFSFMGHSYRV